MASQCIATADRNLLTQAGLTVSRLYAQIPLVYATQTPDWTKIDPLIASIQAAGQKPLIQMSLTPLMAAAKPEHVVRHRKYDDCSHGREQWGQIAASYVAHFDAVFPGFVRDYEIWNEPNATGLCASTTTSRRISRSMRRLRLS